MQYLFYLYTLNDEFIEQIYCYKWYCRHILIFQIVLVFISLIIFYMANLLKAIWSFIILYSPACRSSTYLRDLMDSENKTNILHWAAQFLCRLIFIKSWRKEMWVFTNFFGWRLHVKSERKVNFWREGFRVFRDSNYKFYIKRGWSIIGCWKYFQRKKREVK